MATERIDNFDDLLGLLERNPEYRARLRQLMLDEEFQQLPAQVQALIQTTQAHSTLLQTLALAVERQTQLLEEHSELLQQHSRTLELQNRTLDMHTQTLELHTRTLARHDRQLARLIGDEAERRIQQNAAAYFSGMLRRIRVTSKFDLADLIDDSVDAGQLTEGDHRSLMALDLALRGIDRERRQPARLAVEISAGICERDIMRAVDRAGLLEKLTGEPSRPVVAGYAISPRYRQLAEDKNVAVRVVDPPDPGEPELIDELDSHPEALEARP